jgi:hypothetical protein
VPTGWAIAGEAATARIRNPVSQVMFRALNCMTSPWVAICELAREVTRQARPEPLVERSKCAESCPFPSLQWEFATNGSVGLFDIDSCQPGDDRTYPGPRVMDVTISPDGTMLASASGDMTE